MSPEENFQPFAVWYFCVYPDVFLLLPSVPTSSARAVPRGCAASAPPASSQSPCSNPCIPAWLFLGAQLPRGVLGQQKFPAG